MEPESIVRPDVFVVPPIVDLDGGLLERWRSGDTRPEILRTSIEWRPGGSADPFVLDLADFFTRAPGATR